MGTALGETRFRYNEWEQMRYSALMASRIDMSRVNLDALMPWITDHFNDIYNIKDFLEEVLKKDQHVCPQDFQVKLVKFLNMFKILQFTTDLWQLLLVSQESEFGMPPFVMQRLKEDAILEQEEEKKRQRNDSSKCSHCSCSRCSKRDDRMVDDKNSNQSSPKRENARSRHKQLDENTPCMSRSKSVEKQGASSTSKYALRKCDDSKEKPHCARCGRSSCSPQSSASSNRSRSPIRWRNSREDDGKQEYRPEKQITGVVEKGKHSDAKDTTAIGSQTSVKCSKTRSVKETLAIKGSSVPKSEHKKTKSDTESSDTANGGKVASGVALTNCTQSAVNNKSKNLKNDSSNVNDKVQVKKKSRKSKKRSSKPNSVDQGPSNSEAGSSKNEKHTNNDSRVRKLMYELRGF